MRESMIYDAAVIGAGPAGALAAYHLARAGRRVALLDKARFPRYKTCGGGLVGRTMQRLPFDVSAVIEQECHEIDVQIAVADIAVRYSGEEPIIRMTMRSRFDALLAEKAEEAGADFLRPCRVSGWDEREDAVILSTDGGETIGARHVIGADGATGVTSRLGGWRRSDTGVPAVEYEVPNEEGGTTAAGHRALFDLRVVPHGYGWVFPKAELVSAGVLTVRRGVHDLRGLAADYVRTRVPHASESDRHGYVIPLRPTSRSLGRGRALLVGDAAGVADPITGEGISFALLTGELAAQAVISATGRPDAVRRRYQKDLWRHVLPELRVARWFADVLYGDNERSVAFLRRFANEIALRMVEVFSGRSTYRAQLARPDLLGALARSHVQRSRRPLIPNS